MTNMDNDMLINDNSDEYVHISEKNNNWTCGCLYKCYHCELCENEGISIQEYFERKDLD